MNYKSIVKTEFMEKEFEEILASDPNVLLGVSEDASDALRRLSVHTVFDLANSRIFNNALRLCDRSIDGSLSRFDMVASDVANLTQLGGELDTAYQKPLEVLDGIGTSTAEILARNLSVNTIRDLAQWPPFQSIRRLLLEENEERDHFDDPDIPNELVPKFNEFPTEKFFYSVYLIDDVPDDTQGLIDLTVPFNLGALKTDSKFLAVRTGYILRYEQSWTAIGLALGNLLHSITLAPGESTRVAMVDWSRRQGVRTTEDISQLEALSNSLMQTRSISEVTSAVAREAQSGFSKMDANSTVSNNAYSTYGLQNPKETLLAMAGGAAIGGTAGAAAGGVAGVGIGAVAGLTIGSVAAGVGAIPGMFIGGAAGGAIGVGSGGIIGATAGGAAAGLATANFGARSDNSSNTQVDAVTTTSSSGRRDLSSAMAQNIMDRTQQHSSSSRNKKASIVQEVRQEEKEQITTRVVTNYNHMHALTMNYFEVVQLYSSKVVARELTKCLYVPFVKIAWNDELVERYKSFLIQNALAFDVAIALARPANLSLLFNSTVNSFTADERQAATDSASPLQSRLVDFNARINVGISANVLAPLYLPSTIEISKIETEMERADIFFHLRDGTKIPSTSTSYGQQETTTFITFTFKMRQFVPSAVANGLPGFSRESVEVGPLIERTLPVVNNEVTLSNPYGVEVSIPVNLSASTLSIPLMALYQGDDYFAIGNRARSIEVPFTQSQVTSVPSSVAYVSKRVNELQKIVLRSTVDLTLPTAASGRAALASRVFNIKFTFVLNGVEHLLTLPFKFREDRISLLSSNQIALECDLVEFDHHAVKQDVIEHLNFNSDYYTQKIHQSLGELEYANLVSQYKYEGRPLLNQVDIKPVAISGNYLVFKSKTADDKAVDQWKQDNGYNDVKIEAIPLGTGGVFGEAVLGRANSAEKLDMTRFWNWQDSPILITPPEIAPLQAGSRATSADVRPGSLDVSLVGTMAPNALPNPESLPAILNTLGSANLFRDMSGIAQSAQLAQTALEQAMTGATATGQMSTENLQKGLDFTKEIAGKIIQMTGDYGMLLANTGFGALTGAAGFPTSGAGKAGGEGTGAGLTPNLGNSNPSVAGALLNHGKKMDMAEADSTSSFEAPQQIPVDTVDEPPLEAPQMIGRANEQAQFDNMVGKRRRTAPRATATPVEVTLNIKHQESGPLDGEFNLEFIGPEVFGTDIRTVTGLGIKTLNLMTGHEYKIQISGFRTQRPVPRGPSTSIAHIPALGGNPAFDIDVAQHIAEERVEILANLVATIPKGRKRVTLTVVGQEGTDSKVVHASASGATSLERSLALEIEPEFFSTKMGKITGSQAQDTSTGTEISIDLTVQYKYLTGNFFLERNDTIL